MHRYFYLLAGISALTSVTSLVRTRVFRPLVYGGAYRTIRHRDKKDFIDVEIVDDDKNTDQRPIRKGTAEDSNKATAGGFLDFIKQGASKAAKSIAKVFDTEDEETKRKKQLKRQMNTEIDTFFKGSGLLGGVFGSLAKSVGGMMMETMADAANDIAAVQDGVVNMLENDEKCVDILGSSISYFPPFSSQSSSMNINGVQKRTVRLAFQVQGSKAVGQVEAQASFSSGKSNRVFIEEAIFRTDRGFAIKLKGGAGGGSGGGGMGPGGGRVIDVETL